MRKIVMFSIFLVLVSWISGQEIQLAPCDDMYADCVPNGAAHMTTDLFVVYESSIEQEQIMMKFDFSGIQGIEIESASLNLHRYFSCGGGGGTTTSMIYMVTEEWDEETWDEHTFAPYDSTSGFAYVFSGPATTQDTWFEVNLSEYVDLWMNGYHPNYGIVIIADEGQRHSKFNSKEAANPDFAPYLNLTLPTDAEDELIASEITLSNYPNPFNPTTTINFSIEPSELNSFVELGIYNLKGQKVKMFKFQGGNLKTRETSIVWDGTDAVNQPVSSGVYWYKLTSGNYSISNKMILMK